MHDSGIARTNQTSKMELFPQKIYILDVWLVLAMLLVRVASRIAEQLKTPCRVPTWVERAKNNTVLKKIELTFRKFQFLPWICLSFWDRSV